MWSSLVRRAAAEALAVARRLSLPPPLGDLGGVLVRRAVEADQGLEALGTLPVLLFPSAAALSHLTLSARSEDCQSNTVCGLEPFRNTYFAPSCKSTQSIGQEVVRVPYMGTLVHICTYLKTSHRDSQITGDRSYLTG